jgi:hypothetical protein
VTDAAQDRREGRGRLSSLDQLPDAAEEDIVWALEALRSRALTQNAILDQFNARLASRGIGPVSKSSFNRWSIRKAIQFRRLDEFRVITSDLVDSLGQGDTESATLAIGEMLKAAIYERLEGNPDDKALGRLARTLRDTQAAQKASAEHRARIDARVASKVEEVADRAEHVMREAGLGKDRIAELRREFLGVGKGGSGE